MNILQSFGVFGIAIIVFGIAGLLFLLRSILQRSAPRLALLFALLPLFIGGLGTLMGHLAISKVPAEVEVSPQVLAEGYTVAWQVTYFGGATSAFLLLLGLVAFMISDKPSANEVETTTKRGA